MSGIDESMERIASLRIMLRCVRTSDRPCVPPVVSGRGNSTAMRRWLPSHWIRLGMWI